MLSLCVELGRVTGPAAPGFAGRLGPDTNEPLYKGSLMLGRDEGAVKPGYGRGERGEQAQREVSRDGLADTPELTPTVTAKQS